MKKILFLIALVIYSTSFGQTAESLESLQVVESFREAQGYFDQASKKLETGNYYGAIADFTKVIEINSSSNAYLNRGNAKYNLKDYYGAIADFTKSLELDPSYVNAYVFRAVSKLSLGDKNGACMDAITARDLGYQNPTLIQDTCN